MTSKFNQVKDITRAVRNHPEYVNASRAERDEIDSFLKSKIAKVAQEDAEGFNQEAEKLIQNENAELAETAKIQRANTGLLQRYIGDVAGGMASLGPSAMKLGALGLAAVPGETGEDSARWLMEKARDSETVINAIAPAPGFDFSTAENAADTVAGNALRIIPAMLATGGAVNALQGGKIATAAKGLAAGGRGSRILSKLIDPQTLATLGIMSVPEVMESATGTDPLGAPILPKNPAIVAAFSVPHALIETAFGINPADAGRILSGKSITRGLIESVKRISAKSGSTEAGKYFVKKLFRGGAELGSKSFGEGFEEVLQGLDEIAAKEFGNNDIETAASNFLSTIKRPETWKELGKNFAIGSTVGLALSGGQSTMGKIAGAVERASGGDIAGAKAEITNAINEKGVTPAKAQELAALKKDISSMDSEISQFIDEERAKIAQPAQAAMAAAPIQEAPVDEATVELESKRQKLSDLNSRLDSAISSAISPITNKIDERRQKLSGITERLDTALANKYQAQETPLAQPALPENVSTKDQRLRLQMLRARAQNGILNLKQAGLKADKAKTIEDAREIDYNRASAIFEYALDPADEQSGKEAIEAFRQYPAELQQMIENDYREIRPEAGKRLSVIPNTWKAKKEAAKQQQTEAKQAKTAEKKRRMAEMKASAEAQAKAEYKPPVTPVRLTRSAAGGVTIVDKSGQVPTDNKRMRLTGAGDASRIEKKLVREVPKAVASTGEMQPAQPAGKSPNTVVVEAEDLSGKKIGTFTAAYDGSEAGAAKAAEQLREKLSNDYDDWSNMGSRAVATDENGRGKFAISPNGKVSKAGTDEAAYTLGDLSREPKTARKAKLYTGETIETGKPANFTFLKNPEKAIKAGATFQQDIEPAGNYVTEKYPGSEIPNGWQTGVIKFKNPLVVPFNSKNELTYNENSWKAALQKKYKKTGKALSLAIVKDGYDGIITTLNGETQEVVDLSSFESSPQVVKPSTIDTPAQGALNSAKAAKSAAFQRVKTLREKIKNEPIGGNRSGLRLELMKATDDWQQAQQAERQAKEAIEKRAQELGKTTKKTSQKNKMEAWETVFPTTGIAAEKTSQETINAVVDDAKAAITPGQKSAMMVGQDKYKLFVLPGSANSAGLIRLVPENQNVPSAWRQIDGFKEFYRLGNMTDAQITDLLTRFAWRAPILQTGSIQAKPAKNKPLYSAEYLAAKYTAKAVKAGWQLLKSGATKFATWAREMSKRFGKAINSKLKALWADLQELNKYLGKTGAISGRPGNALLLSEEKNIINQNGVDLLQISVVQDADIGQESVEILPKNTVIFHSAGFSSEAQKKDKIVKELKAIMPFVSLPSGQYWRMTNNKDEINLAKKRILNPSRNHATNENEKGVSVADNRGLSIFGYKYGYIVKGKVIGTGSDGEPVLDPKTISVIGSLKDSEKIANEGWADLRKTAKAFAEKNNWTEKAAKLAMIGYIKPENNLDKKTLTTKIKEFANSLGRAGAIGIKRPAGVRPVLPKTATPGKIILSGAGNAAEKIEKSLTKPKPVTVSPKFGIQTKDLVWTKQGNNKYVLTFKGKTLATLNKTRFGWAIEGDNTRGFLSATRATSQVKAEWFQKLKTVEKKTNAYKKALAKAEKKAEEKRRKNDDYFADKPAPELEKPKTAKDKIKRFFYNMTKIFTDKTIRLKMVQDEAAKKAGIDRVKDEQNAFERQEILGGRIQSRIEDFKESFWQPMLDELNKSGISYESFNRFLRIMHAEERNEHVKRINPEFRERAKLEPNNPKYAGSGILTQDARAEIAQMKKDETYDQYYKIGEKYWNLNKKLIEKQMKYGLIPPDVYEVIRDKYKFYAPIRRLENEGMAMGKRALGKRTESSDQLAHTLNDIEETFGYGENNRKNQAFYRFVVNNPNPALYTFARAEKIAYFDEQTGEVKYRLDESADKDRTLNVRFAGQPFRIVFNDLDLFRALKNPSSEGDEKWRHHKQVENFLRTINNTLGAAYTAYNPDFIFSNLIRDVEQAGFVAGVEQSSEVAQNIITGVPAALKTAAKYYSGVKDADTAMFKRFERSGGRMGFGNIYELKELAANLQSEMDERLANGALYQGKEAVKKIGEFVKKANAVVESGVRFSAWKAAIESGMSEQRAAAFSAGITANFSKGGTIKPLANSLWLFSGAGLVGAGLTARVLNAARKTSKGRAMIAGAIALGFLSDVLNRMMSDYDEEEGKSEYDKISAEEKDSYLFFMLPGTKSNPLKIPLLRGFNVLPALGRNVSAMMFGDQTFKETMINVLSAGVNSLNPIGGDKRLFGSIVPTALKLPFDLATNSNWTGNKIRPDQLPFSSPVPYYKLYNKATNKQLIALSKFMSDITGGNEYEGGWIEKVPGLRVLASPAELQHAVETVTGGPGKTITRLVDTASRIKEGKPVPASDIPLVRVFTRNTETLGLYDRFDKNIDQVAQYENAVKDGNQSFINKNKWLGQAERLKNVTEKRIKMIRKNTALEEDKRRELIVTEQKRFNKNFEAIKKKAVK